MILIDKTEVTGFEQAIRGMRNPMNSWEKSDSNYHKSLTQKCDACGKWQLPYNNSCDGCSVNDYYFSHDSMAQGFAVGVNDQKLMMKLAKSGPVHAKFRRMIVVYADITAPLYWWKEFDTYKVGTVANSCSTMHKIHEKEFTLDDFSHEHLIDEGDNTWSYGFVDTVCNGLNSAREKFLETGDKKYWWQMIQLLPSSYNQKRTVMLNYEVLAGIYPMRRNHKLDEWHDFCRWIEKLPYSEIIYEVGADND